MVMGILRRRGCSPRDAPLSCSAADRIARGGQIKVFFVGHAVRALALAWHGESGARARLAIILAPALPRIVMPVRPIELAAQHAAALKICGRIRTGTDHCDRVSLTVLLCRPQREYRALREFRTGSLYDVCY
jgi:hypothetical protein